MQIRLDLGGALSHSGRFRFYCGHSTIPRRTSDIHSLPGCEEDTPARRGTVMAYNTADGRHSGGSDAGR